MKHFFKKSNDSSCIKIRIEYHNALGMPILVTKKVEKAKLQEFLACHSLKLTDARENIYRIQ